MGLFKFSVLKGVCCGVYTVFQRVFIGSLSGLCRVCVRFLGFVGFVGLIYRVEKGLHAFIGAWGPKVFKEQRATLNDGAVQSLGFSV